jgi:hypothetical protein
MMKKHMHYNLADNLALEDRNFLRKVVFYYSNTKSVTIFWSNQGDLRLMDILQTKVRIKLILARYMHITNDPNANNNDFFSSLKNSSDKLK